MTSLPVVVKFIFSYLLLISGVQSTITVQTDHPVHASADFFKLVNLNPARLNTINQRVLQVRSDIKKLDEKVDKLQKNYESQKTKVDQINTKLDEITKKIDQIVTNTKPKTANLNLQYQYHDDRPVPSFGEANRNKRIVSNQRILVGRSIVNDETNHDEYTNEFRSGGGLNDQSKSLDEFIQDVIDWQRTTDTKMAKIMNAVTEIYKEDKQLSLDLSKLNERSQRNQTSEDRIDLFERMRKEFKEQFSVNKAELKNYISDVNENCLRTKTQNENLTFLLLGIKDDLGNPMKTSTSKFGQENSVLQPDDETHLLDTTSSGKSELFCKGTVNLINNTIELFRTDLNNVRQQIIGKLDKENTRINERIYTLNNNYQHLNNLRNCNSTAYRPQSIDQTNQLNNNVQNEIDTHSMRSSFDTAAAAAVTVKPFEYTTATTTTSTTTSTFIPPFYQAPRKRDDDPESRSKSNPRTKRINPIKYGQIKKRNCHVPNLVSPANCEDLYMDRVNCDGVYVVLFQDEAIRVYCEMDDGGSTVIMRRGQFNDYPLTMFNQDWESYRKGFGNIDADFWLGLDKIHQLTRSKNQMLEIDLESFSGEQLTLKFDQFYVDDESNNYKLTIGKPAKENSNYASLFLQHNGASFATHDRNNAFKCARKFEAGWWYFDNFQCKLMKI